MHTKHDGYTQDTDTQHDPFPQSFNLHRLNIHATPHTPALYPHNTAILAVSPMNMVLIPRLTSPVAKFA
jgi:hypothetical protein